ncbi:MAG TPA: MFS transporter [Candidatus Acidoferrum sp.]|nr:MFS transporter [Candidatus Acidoferrum sp.]
MDDGPIHRRRFRLLWSGQFVSDLGGQLTTFALPAIAIVSLKASALQIGALQAFEFAVVPLLATLAGVIADRYPRKRLMIASNVVRLLALASIPAAWAMHVLTLAQFFVVGAVCAASSVVFDTAYAAFLPSVCGRERYHRAIARMAMSGSIAEAAGSTSGGAIVQILGAPFAVLVNVATYVVSTLNLLRIHVPEDVAPGAESQSAEHDFGAEARAGFTLVARDPILRAVALCMATAYLGGAMVTSVFALYCYRQLHLSPAQFGLIIGLANLGLIGAMIARRTAERFGTRRTLIGATLLSALGKSLFLVHAAPIAAVFLGRLLLSLTGPITSTTQQALQTANVPDALLGRMNAAMRTIVWAALPIGSFLGGVVATVGGIPTTIALGSSVSALAVGWLVACPALSRRRRPARVPAVT